MRRRKKGKKFTLLCVSFTVNSKGPFCMYMAVPALMRIPTMTETEWLVEQYGIPSPVNAVSISNLGDFDEGRLPEKGCIIISRTEHSPPPPPQEEKWDKGPKMIRMDWTV